MEIASAQRESLAALAEKHGLRRAVAELFGIDSGL